MSRRTDKALVTALQILDGQICECGCHESEHAFFKHGREKAVRRSIRCNCRRGCKLFRPVQFTVSRTASQANGRGQREARAGDQVAR